MRSSIQHQSREGDDEIKQDKRKKRGFELSFLCFQMRFRPYLLARYHDLPEYMRFNEFMLTSYRYGLNFHQTLISAFHIHNGLPFFFFFFFFVGLPES